MTSGRSGVPPIDQDAGLARLQTPDQLLHGVATLHGVAVHAVYGPGGELAVQAVLGLLGAQAVGQQSRTAAFRTGPGQGGGGAAVVAAQAPLSPVHGQSGVAGPALGHPAAVVALQGGCVAAAVEKQQYLAAAAQALRHRGHQRG